MSNRLTPTFSALLVTVGGLLLSFAVGANSVQTVKVAPSRDGAQEVQIELKDPLDALPIHFTTSNPNRIVLDFAATSLPGGRISERVGAGVLRAYNALQAGDRTRVVIDLSAPAAYDLRKEGNRLTVAVRPADAAAARAPAAVPTVAAGRAAPHALANRIRRVDFRRGPNGEARIEVAMTDPGAAIDVRQRGQTIQVDFLDTALPAELQRRLDVTDFATPAQTIETTQVGGATRMLVTPRGKWDFFTYQTADLFTLEVRPLDDERLRPGQRPVYSGEKLTLDFQDTPIRQLLYVIGEFTGKNIVINDSVSGNITIRLRDVPWDQALDIILKQRDLDKRVSGNVILIAPRAEFAAKEKAELEAKREIASLEELVTESIRLNYLRASDAQAILLGGNISAVRAGQKVSCDASEMTAFGGAPVGATGLGTGLAGGAGTATRANRILSERGSSTFDQKTNTLFINDLRSRIEAARELLAQIDVPSRQVLIEARLVVADDGFQRQLGARLGFMGSGALGGTRFGGGTYDSAYHSGVGEAGVLGFKRPVNVDTSGNIVINEETGLLARTTPPNVNFQVPGAPAFGVSIFNPAAAALLSLELQALEADNRGKIISNPRVVTSNQTPAVILQGKQIPYQSRDAQGTPRTEFRDAALCLLVDPQILNNDEIVLDVEVRNDTEGKTTQDGQPTIDTNRVRTNLKIRSGETAVLGGVFTQVTRNDTYKVPFLGDVPVLGRLFRSNTRADNKQELLIFLTPRVLGDAFLSPR